MNDDFLYRFFVNPFSKIFFILLFYFLISTLIKKAINSIFSNLKGKIRQKKLQARSQTIRSLLKNSTDLILFFVALLMIFSQLGINITPLLTGAGIMGLAISFGAQTLVKDIISGFFILIEDQFDVGDYIKIGNFEGKVIKISLRMTVLEDKDKNLIYIPNSQILSVIKLQKNQR